MLHTQGQRGPSNDRWIDDGQSQAGAPATEIAQVIEEQFLLPLCSVPATNASIERRFQNSGVLENKPFDIELELIISNKKILVLGTCRVDGQEN